MRLLVSTTPNYNSYNAEIAVRLKRRKDEVTFLRGENLNGYPATLYDFDSTSSRNMNGGSTPLKPLRVYFSPFDSPPG